MPGPLGTPTGEAAAPALLLAQWAASLAHVTRGGCTPSQEAREAALLLFARFRRADSGCHPLCSCGSPCLCHAAALDACDEGPLDVESLQPYVAKPVSRHQRGHLAACLWCASVRLPRYLWGCHPHWGTHIS